jgi:hypothetical protein
MNACLFIMGFIYHNKIFRNGNTMNANYSQTNGIVCNSNGNHLLKDYIRQSNQHIFDAHLQKYRQKPIKNSMQNNRLLFYGLEISNIAKRI